LTDIVMLHIYSVHLLN